MPTLAAVDIGSNSVRLKIARLKGRRLETLHDDREVTRLGDPVFREGIISPEVMADTVKVLRRFHRAVQAAGTDLVRVVGTSALRDARNSQAFLEWVRSATGWTVEIISGIEEARLIHLGIVSSSPRMTSSDALMMDLGGGSCELTLSSKAHIRETVSLPLGAVRLTKNSCIMILRARRNSAACVASSSARSDASPLESSAHVLPWSLPPPAPPRPSLPHWTALDKARRSRWRGLARAMSAIAKKLARLSLDQRRKLFRSWPRRAEIIIAGATVYSELLNRCSLQGFRYSPLGLRDGLLQQMAADYDRSTRSGKQIESEREDSMRSAVEHYRVDLDHVLNVRKAAMQLFVRH